MFKAITRGAATTKYTDIGWPMSALEAVVSAPTVENRTESGCTNPRCYQRMQAREIEMDTIRSDIYGVWETPANTIVHIFRSSVDFMSDSVDGIRTDII